MDRQLLLICVLTFVIHLIGTLASSVRIAGTRTRRIALSLSLFNVLVLVSRTSNSFQAPLLARRVEQNLEAGLKTGTADFRWLLAFATLATFVGALLIPAFQRLLSRWVESLGARVSMYSALRRAASRSALARLAEVAVIPRWGNITQMTSGTHIPWSVAAINTLAMAVWSVGVFASLYAGYLRPELRVTASQMSSIVNGVATILMFVVIDPYLSVMTDDVVAGKVDEPYFRRSIVWLTASRMAGTVLAQILLVPAALSIVALAELL